MSITGDRTTSSASAVMPQVLQVARKLKPIFQHWQVGNKDRWPYSLDLGNQRGELADRQCRVEGRHERVKVVDDGGAWDAGGSRHAGNVATGSRGGGEATD